ncbi:MAG: DNA polymerase I [Candidatus Dojkabacteria bacterium]
MNLIKTSKDRFLAIDANAIVHRAFHAYPPTLQTEDGLQVNAVYGFTVMLLSALKTFDPKYVLCSFDTPKPTFRHVEYVDYKATRKPTDQSLTDQFPFVEEVLKAFNIPILKKEGFEADDILGTISKYVDNGRWKNENLELYILSGDRDLLQLVNEDVKVCLPSGNFKNLVAYDREKTFEYMGIYPEQIVDYKGIAGDPSDNIPGIKGIGNKTAIELLNKYGDLDTVYKNLKDVKPRTSNLLLEGVEQAELSRKLAKIEREVDVNVRLEECLLRDFEKKEVLDIFKSYSFKSLIPRLDEIKKDERESFSSQLDIFSEKRESVEWSQKSEIEEEVQKAKEVYLVYVGKGETAIEEDFFLVRSIANGHKDFLCKELPSVIGKVRCKIITYGWEEIASKYENIDNTEIIDIALLAHLVSSEKKSFLLKDLAFDYSSKSLPEKISPSDLSKVLDAVGEIEGSLTEKVNKTELYEYTKKSINQALGIRENILLGVLKKIEIPISMVLSKMEKRGIKMDLGYLEKLNTEVVQEVESISKDIFDTVGHEFNINSPKQLSDVLFNELGLQGNKKLSTRESVLSDLVGQHPCIEKVLEFRELSKIYSTYTNPLLQMARSDSENAIHTDFKQMGTSSGRLSSVNPNMQNLPAQGEWADKLRKAFVSREGFKFIGVDYSQIELRIMADMSNDDLLIEDFRNGLDIHKATASRILDKEIEDITKAERSIGKTVNFGILFGQSSFGLASMLKISNDVALGYIQAYFAHYVGVEEYIRSLEKEAYKYGYVQSMFGTTRRIRGITSKNIRMRRAAQREAVNMPIQGSESDIMKLAMIQLDDLIQKEFKGKAYILLQIHDELVFEVKDEEVKDFESKALEIMKNAVCLEAPLDVHSSIGTDMSELK